MLKSDRWIRKMSLEHDMINPFSEKQVREGVISSLVRWPSVSYAAG